MEKKTLHIDVLNKIATYRSRDGIIVCGNSDYQIQFTFDSMWDEYDDKNARFIWNNQYIDVPFSGNICDVPVITDANEVTIGVYAGDIRTTTGATIHCQRSILCGGARPNPETDKNYASEAQEAAKEAKAYAELAATYVPKDGKNAYEYALEGGYTGTETEFAEDINPDNIKAAAEDGLSQVEAPQIISDATEMTDTSKHYVLDGFIYSYRTIKTGGGVTSPNMFVQSTATLNARLSGSSGKVTAGSSPGAFVTDFIAVSDMGSISPYNMRLNFEMVEHADNKVVFFDSSKTRLGNNIFSDGNTNVSNGETVIDLKTMHTISTVEPSSWADVAFVRLQLFVKPEGTSATSADIANCTITFDANNVVTEPTETQEWVNSGITYAPTFKTDLIGVLTEDNVIYLSDNALPSGTYTLKYGDKTYSTIGTITIE